MTVASPSPPLKAGAGGAGAEVRCRPADPPPFGWASWAEWWATMPPPIPGSPAYERLHGPEPAPVRQRHPADVVAAAGRLLASARALRDEINPDLEPQAEIAARSLLHICAELWLEVRR